VDLDPAAIVATLKAGIPARYHEKLVVVGSVAVACHFAAKLTTSAINTKDADVIVEPSGSVRACRQLAEALLKRGWGHRRERGFDPQPSRRSKGRKPYVKLELPGGGGFFVEFLGIPRRDEPVAKREVDLELPDGWYAMPVFRFMRLTTVAPCRSPSGLHYAAPWMMALANLLSHPRIGEQTMSYDGRLRAAKDLGRVLAIARLSEVAELEAWPARWEAGLRECFPRSRGALARGVDRGLVELFTKPRAVKDAIATVDGLGLLRGSRVSEESLRATAGQLQALAIEPLKRGVKGE